MHELSTKVERFPSNGIAAILHFVRAVCFEAVDPQVRMVPVVEFGRGRA